MASHGMYRGRQVPYGVAKDTSLHDGTVVTGCDFDLDYFIPEIGLDEAWLYLPHTT
jgi:hypothetical protein